MRSLPGSQFKSQAASLGVKQTQVCRGRSLERTLGSRPSRWIYSEKKSCRVLCMYLISGDVEIPVLMFRRKPLIRYHSKSKKTDVELSPCLGVN